MNKTPKTILVTGVGGPAGINAARLLRAIPELVVIGCDIDPLASGRHFVDTFLLCPPVRDAAAYEAWIKTTVASEAVAVLIPTVHEELPLLATFVADLPCYVPLSPRETLVLGTDKKLQYEWIGAHVPEDFAGAISLADWYEGWSTEAQLFLKPRFGRGGRGCVLVSIAELKKIKDTEPKPDEWLVMVALPGTEWTVDAYVAADGSVVYCVPRERLGLAGGISIKGKTVHQPAVIAATKRLLAALPCRGPVCIQWKADAAGVPKFIEINPRLSGGLMISVAGGINPITAMLAEAAGDVPSEQSWEGVTVLGYYEYKKV